MNSMKLKCAVGGRLVLCLVLGFTIVTAMTAVVATTPKANADTSATSTALVTISSTCTMSAVVNTPHEASVIASTYRPDIGKTTISTICNDVNGYSIYAIGYTNTEWGRNDMLGTTTGRTIATGTATNGDTSNWAMKLTLVAGDYAPSITTGYSAYHVVPNEYVKVASYNNTTGDSSNPSQLETTYAIYAAGNQAPDTYAGKVKYTLVHSASSTEAPCMGTYTINYNANGGSGTMASQTVCANKQVAILPNGFTPPAPTAENQFAAVWTTAADGSGYTYSPGQLVTNLVSVDGSITLYAQWAPKYIQDLTPAVCRVATLEEPLTVFDRRDGSDYTVQYINGACWMTQNLRITGIVYSTNSNFSTYDSVDVCEGDLTGSDSDTYEYTRCHDSGNTANGVWYNYVSATAKTIRGTSNNTAATEDICPANWHLPSHNTDKPSGSFNSLLNNVDYRNLFMPVTGGYYSNGLIGSTNSGYWWSTIAYNYHGNIRYHLYGNSNAIDISLSVNGTRSNGLSVRCVRF